jgi:hypothetical protein
MNDVPAFVRVTSVLAAWVGSFMLHCGAWAFTRQRCESLGLEPRGWAFLGAVLLGAGLIGSLVGVALERSRASLWAVGLAFATTGLFASERLRDQLVILENGHHSPFTCKPLFGDDPEAG